MTFILCYVFIYLHIYFDNTQLQTSVMFWYGVVFSGSLRSPHTGQFFYNTFKSSSFNTHFTMILYHKRRFSKQKCTGKTQCETSNKHYKLYNRSCVKRFPWIAISTTLCTFASSSLLAVLPTRAHVTLSQI